MPIPLFAVMLLYSCRDRFEKLLGDINWIHPFKTDYSRFKALFDCLKSDSNPSSKRKLTSEAGRLLLKWMKL